VTLDEARELLIGGMNFVAYRETPFSLYDSDKNRLFGAQHYNSGRFSAKPSPWPNGDFEEKMATLLHWANFPNASLPAFTQAQELLRDEDSVLGSVIRRMKAPGWKPLSHAELINE
jgi:hypothetical protein